MTHLKRLSYIYVRCLKSVLSAQFLNIFCLFVPWSTTMLGLLCTSKKNDLITCNAHIIRRFVVYYRWIFLRVVPYFDEPVGWVKIQTTSKNSQRYYTTKRLIRDLLSNTPNCYVRAGECRGYLFTGNAWQKLAKRNEIGPGNPANWLVNSKQTCLIGPLAYKYLVIFVLVLGVICILRSAVG